MGDGPTHAVILAAGRGRRMWPLTQTVPKPCLPAGPSSLLGRLVEQCARAGVQTVCVVAGEPDGAVVGTAERAAKRADVHLDVSVQAEQRGTGHALAQADIPDEPTLVCYGDLFLPRDALPGFAQDAAGPTIGAREVEDVSEYGALRVERDKLAGIEEKPDRRGPGLANAGVYVLPAGFQDALAEVRESTRGEIELTDAITRAGEEGTSFTVHRFEGWLDVGWPWDLLAANASALEEIDAAVHGTVEGDAELRGPVHVAEGATVRTGTVVEGPAWIGPGASVGPNAYVRGATRVGPDAKVGHACEVKNSVLLRGAKVPHVSYVGDSVLGPEVNLGAGTQVANLRHDEGDVHVLTPRGRVASGRRKLGVILGEGAKTGINATLNVGVMLAAGEGVAPGETVMVSRLPDEA